MKVIEATLLLQHKILKKKTPEITCHFNSIKHIDHHTHENLLIRHTKRFDETVLHVKEILQKRMELATKNLWKTHNNAEMRENSPDQLTPETTKGNLP